MKYIVTLNGKNYEVMVDRGEASVLSVSDAPKTAPAPVAAPVQAPAPAPAAAPRASAAPSASGEKIFAPMPGVIVDVKVSAGQAVKKGQVLLVFEAMKMENDIVSPRDAVVAQIAVDKGASINTGDLLAVIS
ncbi:MAG: biotin/lipoyl-containing protein [Bacillota bacterium]|nr:biotin/lipoyl-containing protein [Bacillota bacterium]